MATETKPKPSSDLNKTSEPSKGLSKWQRNEIAKRLGALAEAVGESLSKERLDLYLQSLKDLEYEPVCEAISRLVLSSRWFPKIPDIREEVMGKQADAKEHREDQAMAAWLRVLDYANHWHPDIGPYHDAPSISARELRCLKIAGGLYMLWSNQDDGGTELAFMRKAFIEAYKRSDGISGALATLGTGENRKRLTAGGFESLKDIIGSESEQ